MSLDVRTTSADPLDVPLATRRPHVVGVNGSPSPGSRTATTVAVALDLLGVGDAIIHLGDLDAAALLGRHQDAGVQEALATLQGADIIVVGTPVYRASYTALTKSIFDLLPQEALAGTVVIPIATGANRAHSLAVDHGIRPLIASLGGWTTPTGVFASHADFGDDGSPLARLIDLVDVAAREALQLAAALERRP